MSKNFQRTLRAKSCGWVLILSSVGTLWAQGPPEIVWQRGGHQGETGAIAYSPLGDIFATASDEFLIGPHDRTIKIFRASDGILLRTILSPRGLSRIAFCSDGSVLAAVHQEALLSGLGTVDLWDVNDGRLLHRIRAGERGIPALACGSLLAITASAGGVELYDLNGQLRQSLPARTGSGLAFSADESLLASTSRTAQTIVLWQRNEDGTYSEREPLIGPTNSSSPVAFSPKGDLLASSLGRDITVWTLSDGKYRTIATPHGINGVAFPANGGLIASHGNSNPSPDRVMLWNLEDGSLFQSLEGNNSWVPRMAVSPDGARLVHSVYPRQIKMWQRTDKGFYDYQGDTGHTDTAFSVAFSPDGRIFASGAAIYDFSLGLGEVKLWNASDGQLLQTLAGHTRGVYGVGFSADSRTLASASWDRTVKVWVRRSLAEPYALLQTLTDHTDQVNAAIFSGNDLLASASKDSTIKIWRRLATGLFALFQTLDRSVGGHEAEVEPLAFSRDGYLLVSGGHDGKVKVWGLRTDGRYGLLQTLEHTEEVESVALSGDQRLIVAGGEDGTVRLWQRGPDGVYVVRDTFEAHSGVVHSLAFSADDLFFVSVGDRTIKFWVSADSTKALTYDQETGTGLRAVAFSPDGSLFGYARDDSTVSVASYPFLGTVFVAYMDGAQETPPVETPANGLAVLALNASQTQVKLVMSAYDLQGPVLFSHVHSAPCGQFGFVEFGITGSDFQNPVVRTWNIPSQLVPRLLDGGLYVNVHTEPHSGGEIRGQVLRPGEHCPPH